MPTLTSAGLTAAVGSHDGRKATNGPANGKGTAVPMRVKQGRTSGGGGRRWTKIRDTPPLIDIIYLDGADWWANLTRKGMVCATCGTV